MTDEFDLSFPATSANLGPAFDAAALALNFRLRVQARRGAAFSISAEGRDAGLCANLEKHLVVEVYRQTLVNAGRPVSPLAMHLNNQIPLGKGCGSSAAARLAGLALAARFGPLDWTAQQIFEAAARLEGHPDNVAACWWGGLVVAAGASALSIPKPQGVSQIHWASIAPVISWPLLLVVPVQPLPTEHARQVLPLQYSRADAVVNLQNALLLLAAFQQGRGDLLSFALHDRLHQPYRATLCPALPALQPLVGSHGILGVALSGAGPSVLMILSLQADQAEVASAVRAVLREARIEAELLEAAIEPRGPGLDWKTS